MSSTQLGRCVDLSEGGGAADPWFSQVEVREPHPPSCDVAVGGVHGTEDFSAFSGGALQPVVSRASRRVALEDLPAGPGWFVGRQSQRARTEWFFSTDLSNFLLDFLQCLYDTISQLLQAVIETRTDGLHSLHKFSVTEIRAGTCTRWSLRARHSIPSRETRKDRTGAGRICYQ